VSQGAGSSQLSLGTAHELRAPSNDDAVAVNTDGMVAQQHVEETDAPAFANRVEFDSDSVQTLRRMSRVPLGGVDPAMLMARAVAASDPPKDIIVEKDDSGRDIVTAATPRAMFEMLFPLDGEQDHDHVALLLHTYRGFMRTDVLLDALFERYARPELCFRSQSYARVSTVLRLSVASRIRLQVHTVLRIWIKNYAIDFSTDAALLRRVCTFIAAPPTGDVGLHASEDEQRRSYLLVLLQRHIRDMPVYLTRQLVTEV
jgi:hypothetical protein